MAKHLKTDQDLNLAALPHLRAGNVQEAARILAASSKKNREDFIKRVKGKSNG